MEKKKEVKRNEDEIYEGDLNIYLSLSVSEVFTMDTQCKLYMLYYRKN